MITCGCCGHQGVLELGFLIDDIDTRGYASLICENCKAKLRFDWTEFLNTDELMECYSLDEWEKD